MADNVNEINGTQEDDALIVGTEFAERIRAQRGDDLVRAGLGNDSIWGSFGNDTIAGEGGNDVIYAQNDDDLIFGDGLNSEPLDEGVPGNDYVRGGDGEDTIFGGGGNDRLIGDSGNDRIFGEVGNDRLEGEGGADFLFGGAGNDSLDGGSGSDELSGGDGNDTLVGIDANQSADADFNSGTDTIDTLTGGAGEDIFALGAEAIYYGDSNPQTQGLNDYALITDFTVGSDVLEVAGLVNDYVLRDSPNSLPSGTAVFFKQSGEADELIAILQGVDSNTLTPAEILQPLGDEENEINGTQDDDVISGTDSANLINAQRGFDLVRAGLGDDVVQAGPGNDTITGEEGGDCIFGFTGDDFIFGDALGSEQGVSGSDTIRGQDGDDTIFGGGSSDRLIGDLGNDRLLGEAGNDRLEGGDGDDSLFGGQGNDSLNGGAGNDTLVGVDNVESGTDFGADTIDTLTGGSGSDSFFLSGEVDGERVVYYSDGNAESSGLDDYALITDFTVGSDLLEVAGPVSDYALRSSPNGLPSGTAVFFEQPGEADELIAVLEGVSSNSLTAADVFGVDLNVAFGDILETPSLLPTEEGEIELILTNDGGSTFSGSVDLRLYASTNAELGTLNINEPGSLDELAGLDEVLTDRIGTDTIESITFDALNLAPGESATLNLDFSSPELRTASVVSPGAYYLLAEVDPNNVIQDSNSGNNLASQFISTDGTDVVLDWNSTFLNAVQAEGEAERGESLTDSLTTATIPGVAPPVVARDGAILHTAIYEAVNALSDSPGGSSLNLSSVPNGASQEAAAVGAAYTVLSELFVEPERGLTPGFLAQQQEAFDLQRDRSLAEISDAPAAEAGFDFGVEVAQTILQAHSDDGADRAQVPYQENARGLYREFVEDRQDPDNRVTALLPDWGEVRPFAIDSIEAFRPENLPQDEIIGLAEFGTDQYAEEIEDVRLLGGLEDTFHENGEIVTDVIRNDEQTEIAQFWSYDRADTFRPPGQWNEIAQEAILSQAEISSIEDNARLFAQLNIAMSDAGIVIWDVKYTEGEEQLRPVTSINEVANNTDPDITRDKEWEPLIPTPPFPDYISGHSAFGGAAAGILEDFFGNNVVLKLPSQELPGITRPFTGSGTTSSFRQAAFENADSKFFGGVHVNSSNRDGIAVGLAVADNILNEGNIFA